MKFRNLVLSGGGVRGIYYLSLMQYFEDNNIDLNDFKNFAGASVGSFFATAIALGYKSYELEKIAINILDYSKLKSMNILDFFDNLGLDKGDKLEHYIKKMIRNKNGDKSLTFIEMYKKFNKNIIIPTVCLSSREIVYFSKESHPNLKIWKAIRMSLGVPFLFKPFIYKNNYYVDGGLKNNFPIDLFNEDTTLGVDITLKKKELNVSFNIEKFILSLVDTVTKNRFPVQKQEVIELGSSLNPEKELLSFQPDIDEETINDAKKYSYDLIDNYFKTRSQDISTFCDTLISDILNNIFT